MSVVTTDSQHYLDIAAAIRKKNGEETRYKPSEMATAIQALSISNGLPEYDGEYEVTPKVGRQTLATAKTVLTKNIEIEAIPYSEVSNESNGITVTIS